MIKSRRSLPIRDKEQASVIELPKDVSGADLQETSDEDSLGHDFERL